MRAKRRLPDVGQQDNANAEDDRARKQHQLPAPEAQRFPISPLKMVTHHARNTFDVCVCLTQVENAVRRSQLQGAGDVQGDPKRIRRLSYGGEAPVHDISAQVPQATVPTK